MLNEDDDFEVRQNVHAAMIEDDVPTKMIYLTIDNNLIVFRKIFLAANDATSIQKLAPFIRA